MAEIESREQFAEILSLGVSSLKRHVQYRTKRKKRESLPSGQFFSESYLDKIALELGVSANTIRSWMGQMGSKYIPTRIEDGKLFGIVWLILEKSALDVKWLIDLLKTTSIPVIDPPSRGWVYSCFSKAKLIGEAGKGGRPSREDAAPVLERLFPNRLLIPEPYGESISHNLPSRWSDLFLGRNREMESLQEWLESSVPICLIYGWGGMGKTTLALETAYHCVRKIEFECVIWISGDQSGLTFNDFLDTIAYQLGKGELLSKTVTEKKYAVRQAIAAYSSVKPILLVVDSIDIAGADVAAFIANLPDGVKALLTARENQSRISGLSGRNIFAMQLEGLGEHEGIRFLQEEIRRLLRLSVSLRNSNHLSVLLEDQCAGTANLIARTAGNPKAISLSVAYLADRNITVQEFLEEIEQEAPTLSALFEYLFGQAWERCDQDARKVWQALSFFSSTPAHDALGSTCGLEGRAFYLAVEQLRSYSLVEPLVVEGILRYHAHPLVLAYVKQVISENSEFESEARTRWWEYYVVFLESHLKREQPSQAYWNCLLGRDLEPVKQEWPNLAILADWLASNDQHMGFIQIMLRISHFLSRVNLRARVEYGRKAADFARMMGMDLLAALFHIDMTGWALLEFGEREEGRKEIEQGLLILKELDGEDKQGADLNVLGNVFLSRYFLMAGVTAQAELTLEEIKDKECSPVIQHRYLLAKGDVMLREKRFSESISLYEQANEISQSYGGEKTIEAFFHLGMAYAECDRFNEAERMFEKLLYDQVKPNQIELIFYYYGMAQLSFRRGNKQQALEQVVKALSFIDPWVMNIEIKQEAEQLYQRVRGGVACVDEEKP